MPNWKKVITSGSDASLNTLTVSNGITGSLFGSSSYALTASYALNGGGGGGNGTNTTASFSNLATWNFNHALNNRNVIIQTYDSSYNQIIPQNINLVDDNNVTIIFPTSESGFAIASLGGSTVSASYASTASYVQNAQTASYVLNAASASFAINAANANTASFVTTAQTASYVAWANVNEATTDTFLGTASYASQALSSSYALTASYALNGGGGGGIAASESFSYQFLLMGA